jgi:heptosyltransferase-2
MNENILVRGVNWIGDAVMTLPALRALRKAFPGSKLSLLVKPSVAAIFDNEPAVDEVLLYGEEFKGIFGRLRLAGKLREKGFSKAILLQNAVDAALIAYLSGIPERIGYDRDRRGKLLTKPVPYHDDDKKVHHIDYYLNLLRAAGISAERTKPWIFVSLDERLAAREKLSALGRPILGINPGAAYGSAKRWLPERFAEVAHWFIKDTKGSVVLFGGGTEVEIGQEIEKKLIHLAPECRSQRSAQRDTPLLNMAGRTSLRELISLITECDVFLSNDSGPMHIACAVGTPLVALFGSTSPDLTGPVGEGNVVIHPDLLCSPCFERECRNGDRQCMNDILPDDVYLAIRKTIPRSAAVFLDRDGTLCEDVNYLSSSRDFRPLPGIDGLAALKGRFRLVGVTNQSGIGRGLVDGNFTAGINNIFVEQYGFDDFFCCPHLPEDYCACRKPEPGMLHDARNKYGIDLRRSYVVGDKDADMRLAKAVGARAVLVRTGQQRDSVYADFVADGLREVVDFIMREGTGDA